MAGQNGRKASCIPGAFQKMVVCLRLRTNHIKRAVLLFVLVLLPYVCWADEYVLIMSKNDNVCQHMMKLYNADLRRYGHVKYKQHKEFNWIKWKEKEIQLRPAGAPKEVVDIDAKITLFDINNDSKDEAIIYQESMLFNRPMDVYDIFKTCDLVMLDNLVDGETYHSKTQKSFDSRKGIPLKVHEISDKILKKIPKQMRDSVKWVRRSSDKNIYFIGESQKIKFLQLNGYFYINFEGPRDIGPKEDYKKVEHYSLIFELQLDNTLKPQCLYLIKKNK